MNNFIYENQGSNTYLVYEIGQDEGVDTTSIGMLTNNKIEGLAATVFTQMDDVKNIKYNVSSRISLEQFFGGTVKKKMLTEAFYGIVNAVLSAEDYMIDADSLVFDWDYIFIDVSNYEVSMVCLPVVFAEQQAVDINKFFKDIMFSIQFDQSENCDYIAKIINYLNCNRALSLTDFKKVISGLKEDTVVRNAVQESSIVKNISVEKQNELSGQVQKSPVKSEAPASDKINIPDKEIRNGQVPETVKTNEKPMSMFYLLNHYNKENKALYKAQKNAKKIAGKEKKSATAKRTDIQHAASGAKTPDISFAIPGAKTPDIGFAVPGESSSNTGFEVSGMKASQTKQHDGMTKVKDIKQESIYQQAYSADITKNQYANAVNQSACTSESFGETVVLGRESIGGTTVLGLGGTAVSRPYLVRIKNNERIIVDKPVFRIGKEKSYVDYFIGDNRAISRSHANIISREDKYFVVDTNSTNHTYVNGQMIRSNMETEIVHGTKIRFANEDFEFNLY